MKSKVFLLFFCALSQFGMSCKNQIALTEEPKKEEITFIENCETCELMFIGMPDEIPSDITSPGWNETGQKLILSGTVLNPDGISPAKDIVLYFWQTNDQGLYAPSPEMDKRVARHGHIRGWVKTDSNGHFRIRTIRPGSYPDQGTPAHIHMLVKESKMKNPYFIDDVLFQDDALVEPMIKKYKPENRGGNGIVSISIQDNIQMAERKIILGQNIPNYPNQQ